MRQKRQVRLEVWRTLLQSDNGKELMEDLKSLFDPPSMKGLPHEVQYMAGQRDVYKYLELLQTGEMIDE